MKTTVKKTFSQRAFITTAMFTAGLGLPVSGIMNHLLQFEPLTRERHFWMAVHDVSAILFLIFGVIHIIWNWRALLRYAKQGTNLILSKEALVAMVLVLFVVGIISSHVFHIG